MLYRSLLLLTLWFPAALIPASATSLRDFEAMSPQQQGRFLSDYVDRMATDISAQNPALGRAIVAYFSAASTGKGLAPGIEDLMVQVVRVDALARQGKADPASIQIEGMIVYVTKQHFSR